MEQGIAIRTCTAVYECGVGGVDSNEAGGDSDDGGCDACREDFGCCTGVLVLVASSIIINLSLSTSHIYSFLGLSFLICILGKQSTFHHDFLASASIAQRDGAGCDESGVCVDVAS